MDIVLHILKVLFVLFEVVLLFNLMIVVHEVGHFLAARWRGLYVERFGVWFGKPLWKKRIKGVEYSLGTIPFGGFVALPQMAPMPESLEGPMADGLTRAELPPVRAIDKIIVAFAGPLFSMLLAVAFAMVVWVVGRPVSEAEASTTVGYVQPDSPAAVAGIEAGDVIKKVDGHPVTKFAGITNSIVWYITRSEGSTIPIELERNGQLLTKYPVPHFEDRPGWGRRATRQIMIEPAYTPMVASVDPGSPAAKAGFKPEDRILKVGAEPIHGVHQLQDIEEESYNTPLDFTVQRAGRTLDLHLPPAPFKLGDVTPHSAAESAGLKAGDEITEIDGKPLDRFSDLRKAVRASNGQPLSITYVHNGVSKTASIAPLMVLGDKNAERRGDWLLGILPDPDAGIGWSDTGVLHLTYPTPVEQIATGVSSIVNTIGALLSPKSDIKLQHLSGPVGIGHGYYNLLTNEQGWRLALWFSVILNVNLALMNLLPIPVLDGGHITLALIEAIRRKPVNVRVLEMVQSGCAVVIIGYLLYVTFYDVGDLALSHQRPEELKFSPPASPAAKP